MSITSIGLLREYENILIGNRENFSNNYLGQKSPVQNAVELLKYVFENLLRWDHKTTRIMLTKDVVKLLHLEQPIAMIPFPPELNPEEDFFYVAWYLYPETKDIRKEDLVLNVYQEVLNGERRKFPKNFFLELEGELNKDICLQYAINQFLYVKNLKELYLFFANKKKACAFLKKYRLYDYYEIFYNDPLDLLHDSLTKEQRSSVYYHYARFQRCFLERKEAIRADHDQRPTDQTK